MLVMRWVSNLWWWVLTFCFIINIHKWKCTGLIWLDLTRWKITKEGFKNKCKKIKVNSYNHPIDIALKCREFSPIVLWVLMATNCRTTERNSQISTIFWSAIENTIRGTCIFWHSRGRGYFKHLRKNLVIVEEETTYWSAWLKL